MLPGGFEISRRKMKGVVSNGMLCSGRELGLSEDHEGILVVLPRRRGAEPGRPALVDALGIEPDTVFDIAVEANRPDAWCVAGIARDLAAALHLPFSVPEPPVPPTRRRRRRWRALTATVEVVDDDLCPRFTARVLLDVRSGRRRSGWPGG